MPVLTGIDTLGVQRYVFRSNRLRDAIAASWLVHWATATEGALAVPQNGSVLVAAGGNAVLRFSARNHAQDFVAQYTRQLHDQAPGLEVAIAHREYEPGQLANAMGCLRIDLARAKLERSPSVPQLGLSVTMGCRITGAPAVGFDRLETNVPLSRYVLRLRDPTVYRNATSQWDKFLEEHNAFDFPPDLDNLGRTREDTSLIGVVHVDGNEIGQQISNWLKDCTNDEVDDEAVIHQCREWSAALSAAGENALKGVIKRVADAVDRVTREVKGALRDLGFKLKPATDGRIYLPIRPVLLGGDDLTFLCDGRIALDLATAAVNLFGRDDIPHLELISACAGVAIVRSHAPFERAYELAENLCANAKRRRREKKDTSSWVDWHIGTSPPGEGIADLRGRTYVSRPGSNCFELTCRPYRLGSSAKETETWRWLSEEVLGTGENGFRGAQWREHRNKVKELASLVREGPEGIRRARDAWTVASSVELPDSLNADSGFLGNRTPLLDAIELLDLHLPLDGGKPS